MLKLIRRIFRYRRTIDSFEPFRYWLAVDERTNDFEVALILRPNRFEISDQFLEGITARHDLSGIKQGARFQVGIGVRKDAAFLGLPLMRSATLCSTIDQSFAAISGVDSALRNFSITARIVASRTSPSSPVVRRAFPRAIAPMILAKADREALRRRASIASSISTLLYILAGVPHGW